MKYKQLLLLFASLLVGGHYARAQMQDKDGVYLISSAEDLRNFSTRVNNGENTARAVLMNDIDLNGELFTPIGLFSDEDKPGVTLCFRGSFDGQGHVVKNLKVVQEDFYEGGLFSRLSSATVKNLGIINADVTSTMSVRCGALTGEAVGSEVRNCYTVGTITLTSDKDQKGGISGEVAGGTVVSNCYTVYDAVIGHYSDGKTVNCYGGDDVAGTMGTGELCFLLNGDQSEIAFYQTLGTDPYPVLNSTHGTVYAHGDLDCGYHPAGNVNYSNEGPGSTVPEHQFDDEGNCTVCGTQAGVIKPAEDGWYEVSTADELRYVSHLVEAGNTGINIRLMNDIDLSAIAHFPPIGLFSDNGAQHAYAGTFDGQYHVISNLIVDISDGSEAGLFSRTAGATLKNFGVINASVTNGTNIRAGVIAGELHNSTVENVFTAGSLSVNTSHAQAGGISGEAVGTNLTGCYTTHDVFTNAPGTLTRCYWGEEAVSKALSGELCYTLNGGTKDKRKAIWFQTIPDDEFPVFDSTHGLVYKVEEGEYASAVTPEDFVEMVTSMVEAEVLEWEEAFVSQALRDAYISKLNAMSSMSYEDYLDAYEDAAGLREALEKSRDAYRAYTDKIAEVSAYIEQHDAEFAGPDRDLLEKYLNTTVEPGEEFLHGSYPYILANPTLVTIDMLKETAGVEEMLNNAVNKGYLLGAEVTSMISNPNFAQANVGWTVENASWPTMEDASGDGVPFGFVSGNAKVSQTLTDLKNGVYLFRMNSYMEINTSTPECAYNFIGFFFANEMANYTHSKFTDLFYEEEVQGRAGFEAVNGVFDDDGVQLYGCTGFNGVSQGFGMGHYDNCILANVTDGTLTIGVHNKGAFARTSDSFLGNARLYYCGEMEEAGAAIDEVLGSMVEKAELICNKYVPSSMTYTEAPAFSKALTEELATLVGEAKSAGDNQTKYACIGKFTDLFQRIYDCKAAYLEMMQTMDDTQTAVYELSEDPELQATFEKMYADFTNHYIDADISQEEAEARIAELKATEYYKLAYGEEPEQVDGIYQLGTPYNLIWFAKKVNSGETGAKAVLTADIDLASINNFTPIGLYSDFNANWKKSFAGTFDGQGHIIYNLRVHQANQCEAGFFSRTAGATLKNFGIVNAHVVNETVNGSLVRAGIMGGECHNCVVENVFTAGELIVETDHDQKCGLFGEAASSTLKNCYTTHPLLTNSGSEANCFADVAGIAATGELAFRLNEKLEEPVYFQTLGEDAYPVLNPDHKVVYVGGRIDCMGNMLETTFSNDPDQTYTRDKHEFDEDGFCIHCGETIDACEVDKDGYYLVATAKNLAWFSEYVNKGDGHEKASARLVADIDMSGITISPIGRFINTENPELPNLRYSGTFEGDGHVIRNLRVAFATGQNAGLIGDLFGGSIYNVGIENITVENDNPVNARIGGLCGHGINARVSNCYVIGDIVLSGGGSYTGALIAHLETGDMTNCYTTYNTLGSSQGTNCYFGNSASEMAATGELCYKLNKSQFTEPTWFQTLGSDTHPVLDATHATVYPGADGAYTNETPELMQHAGTIDDPFVIKSAQDLCNVSDFMTEDTLNYIVLANDIDMSEVNSWTPLNLTKKWIDFDGQGHVIRNFRTNTNATRNLSLFGIFGGRLRNLGVENADVQTATEGSIDNTTLSGAGILAGYAGHANYKDTSYVEHVYVTGKISISDRGYAAGMFGAQNGPMVMHNCYANVELRSNASYVGGLIGRLRASLIMRNCYAAGSFNRGGGIIGGGQEDGTPASVFENVVVWNNDYENFGDLRIKDDISGVRYYYGNNFAELQKAVVAWDPTLWSCDMEEGSYPVLVGTVTGIQDIWVQNLKRKGTYDLSGRKLSNTGRLPKGIYVIDGKKVVIK